MAKTLTNAERLEVAGALAPVLRSVPDRARARKVTLYNRSTGEVTGHTTLGEAQRGLLRTLAIEIDVADGVKAETIICKVCGRPVKRHGKHVTVCNDGCRGRQCEMVIDGARCEQMVGRQTAKARAKASRPIQCRLCSARNRRPTSEETKLRMSLASKRRADRQPRNA